MSASLLKTSPLRLHGDAPALNPGYGTVILAETLAGILAEPHQEAMVLGLHGPWGSGKSTLMKAIAGSLRDADPAAIFIEFNAWKYQDREALWRALTLLILQSLRAEIEGWPEAERLQKEKQIGELERSLFASFTARDRGAIQVNWVGLATEIVLTLIRVAGGGLVSGILGQAGKALKSFFDTKDKGGSDKEVADTISRASGILHREVVERNVEQVKAIDQFLERYQRLTKDLGKAGKRIYVLIDDLDRCLPDEALSIFEAIKLFLDAPECRYIVAVDRGMIRRGLQIRYKDAAEQIVDPDEYIEKTISLSFDLPQLQAEQARHLLRTVGLTTLDDAGQPDPWHTAIIDALGTNPRRLKRVANTLRVTRALAARRGAITTEDSKLLLKLGLIAYRNSNAFDVMRRDFKMAVQLQRTANKAAQGSTPPEAEIPRALKGLADDSGFWNLLRREPDLTEDVMRKGAAWFQPNDSA